MNAIAYIGLGANLGDPKQAILTAVDRIRNIPGVLACELAHLFGSDPIDATGPSFINTVAKIETTLAPLNLLDTLLAIEQEHGRARPYQNAPRTLDLDLLWYDGLQIHTPRLTLPHPRAHQRSFVLVPLSELAPDLVLPEGHIQMLLKHCADQNIWRA